MFGFKGDGMEDHGIEGILVWVGRFLGLRSNFM